MGIAEITQLFPAFPNDPNRITSLKTPGYNCIAWAVGDTRRWWWPTPPLVTYWPEQVPRDLTLEAFVGAFAAEGFEPCDSGRLEEGWEKVALYSNGSTPEHAARQLPDGAWTSKLGVLEDVRHQLPELEGESYGQVTVFMRRRREES